MVNHALRVGAAAARVRLPELIGDAFRPATADLADGPLSTPEPVG
jgi:hypothetical protein